MSTRRSAASAPHDRATARFAHAVADHLRRRPRQLPTEYLYDPLGSSLFEAICHLPWYRIATIEHELLRANAADINARLGPLDLIVELGPGSGGKLAALLRHRTRKTVSVQLVDVSTEALDQASRTLASERGVSVQLRRQTYGEGLMRLARSRHRGTTLVVFLGSNIGNFDAASADALLRGMRAAVRTGGAILLGTDLVKPESELLRAYDDPLGVTAAFNRNLLVRINRELQGSFELERFAHRAVWNEPASRVEMHLVSLCRQTIHVRAARLRFRMEEGETIWTESSYKYRVEALEPMLARARFAVAGQWVSDGFALTLARAV